MQTISSKMNGQASAHDVAEALAALSLDMPGKAQTDAIARTLRLSRARDLADQGRWLEAEHELCPHGDLPDDELMLHACAVVVTRSGNQARALPMWRLLQQRSPGHAEAGAMIAAIELWLSRPWWHRYVPAAAGVLALLVMIPVCMLAFSSPKPSPSSRTPAAQSLSQAPVSVAPRATSASSPLQAAPLPVRPATPPQEEEGPRITFPGAKPAPRKK